MYRFVGVVLLALLALSSRALAAPLMIAGDINNGTLFCATDNNAGCANGIVLLDLDPTIGILDLGDVVVGGLNIEGSLHSQEFGPPLNILNSSSLTIENLTGSAISLQSSISGNNFPGPTSFIANSGSGTWQTAAGSNATYSFWADPANAIGANTATDRPGFLVSQFSDTAVGLVDSFAVNGGPFPYALGGPFSMTLGFDMTLVAGGELISRGQTQISDVGAVPEPMSLSLLGLALAGFGYRLRRRA